MQKQGVRQAYGCPKSAMQIRRPSGGCSTAQKAIPGLKPSSFIITQCLTSFQAQKTRSGEPRKALSCGAAGYRRPKSDMAF